MRKSRANFCWVVSFLILLTIGSLDFCTQAASSENDLALPELYYNNKTSFLQLLDLNDGKIKRIPIVPNIYEDTVERVIDLGNQSVALICRDDSIGTHCGDHEGYVYIYNFGTKKLTELDFRADDSDNIEIGKSKNGLYFGIDYTRRSQDFNKLENETRIYQINPVKIRSKWISNSKGWFYGIDDKSVYYTNDKDELILYDIVDGNQKMKYQLPKDYSEINNGKVLVCPSPGNNRLIDILNQKDVELPLKGVSQTNFSEDGKWILGRIYINSVKYSGKVIIINTDTNQIKEEYIAPEIINNYFHQIDDAMFIRTDKVYFIGKKAMVSVDLATGNTKTLPLTYATAARISQTTSKPSKTDEVKIRALIGNYEKSLIEAINTNKFALVAGLLQPDSSLYKSQQKLVADLYHKKTQEKLVKYAVTEITTVKTGIFQVKVTEQIGIKAAEKTDFTVKEFSWVYTVVKTGEQYRLSVLGK